MEAVAKWRQYLLGRQFIIRTDHKSLKELLTQVIQNLEPQYFLQKLLGYQFTIEYKSGQYNATADSLFGLYKDNVLGEVQQLSMAISTFHFDLIDVLHCENQTFPDLLELHTCIQRAIENTSPFSSMNGLLLFRGRLVLGKNSTLKMLLLKEFHETPMGGHAGSQCTYICLATKFFFGRTEKRC